MSDSEPHVTDSEDRSAASVPAVARMQAWLAETQEQLAATSEILAVLGTSSSGEAEVFEAIVERARRLCWADAAQIHIATEHNFTMVHSVGQSPEYLALALSKPVPLDRTSLVGRVGLDGRTQQIVDVLADPDYDRPEFQRVSGIRTIIGAPMIVEGEVVGVLSVWRTTVDPFGERVSSLLSTFAAQGALALRNVALFRALESRSDELSRKVEQLEALSAVDAALSSSLDPDEVLTTIVKHAVELSETDGGSLMEYDEDTRLFSVRTAYGTSRDVVERLRRSRIHVDETFVGRTAASRTVAQIPDLSEHPDLDPHLSLLHDAGWRSLVAIPLTRADRIVGALVVRRKQPGTFSDETCELLSAFASQSAIALTNARLYQELERQSAELAEASRHKSEFLASMSHELRTPLNAVIGFSEVLLERMFGELNDRQADYLQDILSAGRHLLALINDVLDLSKVEAGQMELDRTQFDVAEAIEYARLLVRERASQHQIDLSVDAPREELGTIWADQLRFKQILLNLLSNAVKFTPDGGSVRVVARRVDGDLEVTVADTGVGIAAEDQPRIFDSFQQGERSSSSAEGTGLGLTLTRRIVELHGGTLWLRSVLGVGSTFGFRIPQTAPLHVVPEPEWDHASAEPEPEPDGRPVILIIEDDESSAELVSLHVDAAGLRPVAVRTGEEGLEAVRSMHPSAVILDIQLPGMDGWDVLSSLKAEPGTAATPVVVVSVLPERGRGFALGAADYLVKPVARADLLAALRRVGVDRPQEEVNRRIVVVDDDQAALELIRVTLEPLGWEVRTCGHGGEAQAVVRSELPAVVLVDLLMPDTDGFEVVDALHRDPETRSIPIVVLTAKTLTAADRRRLKGRVEFVASKSRLDLIQLSTRLAGLAGPPAAVPDGRPS
jgi:signal transduction histidine kinase/DNA-binding response OmpR family regulator